MRLRSGLFARALAAAAVAAAWGWAATTIQPARATDTPGKSPSATVQPTAAADADWPQWRGVHRDGKSAETGLLKQWPKGGPPLAWKANGIGSSMGSVAVTGGRIYTNGDLADGAYLHCLDEKDGRPIWKSKIGKGGTVGAPAYAGPRGTPTVAGDRVYVLSQFGDVVCFQTADGREVWRKNLVGDFHGRVMESPNKDWGWSESPLVDGGKVMVTPGGKDGTMVALDANTGNPVWRTKDWTDAAAYCSAIVAEIGGVRQYIQLTGSEGRGGPTVGHVAGVAADSGKVLWKAERDGSTAVIPTPVYQDGYVYATSGYGAGCDLFKVTPQQGAFKVETVYSGKKNKVMANHHGGVVLVDGYVYGFSEGKGWTCQDLRTGEAAWKQKENAVGKGSIAYADGHLYLRDEGGKATIALIEASPKGYKEVGRFDQPDRSRNPSWAHPVVANGKLYIRDQDVLLCYDVKAK